MNGFETSANAPNIATTQVTAKPTPDLTTVTAAAIQAHVRQAHALRSVYLAHLMRQARVKLSHLLAGRRRIAVESPSLMEPATSVDVGR